MTAPAWETASFQLVDPRSLLIDHNTRTTGDLNAEDPDFVASIATNGVRIPVIANPTDDGRLRVKDGSRRTIAAVLADQSTIPAIVTDATDVDSWTWLVDQWIANEVRAGFTASDKARIMEELALFDMSAEDIARRLSISTEQVTAGLRIRRSRTAVEAAQKYAQLDVLQVAALAEFEDDPEALQQLRETLEDEPEQFDHEVSRLRLDRRTREAKEELTRHLADRGIEVVAHTYSMTQRRLSELLRSAEDRIILGDDPEGHADCPGHAAYITTTASTGEAGAVYVCQDWKRHGHIDRYSYTAGPSQSGPKSEQEKAELRRTKANNKAWRAAEPVRRAFIKDKLLTRKTPPAGVQQFDAAVLVNGDHAVRRAMERQHRFACELLGLEEPAWGCPNPLLRKLQRATNNEAIMLKLAIDVAAIEDATGVHTWRNPTDADKRYFTALRTWGYTLSPVELLVLNPDAADDIDDDLDDETPDAE